MRKLIGPAMLGLFALTACGPSVRSAREAAAPVSSSMALFPNETPALRDRIDYWAREYDVPPALVQRLVLRESRHNPAARNGPYWGLLQIRHDTARGMGYRGTAEGLLDPDTNLKYGVKYLRGAYLVADGHHDDAIKWYAQGYYYEAKRKGLLEETGLR